MNIGELDTEILLKVGNLKKKKSTDYGHKHISKSDKCLLRLRRNKVQTPSFICMIFYSDTEFLFLVCVTCIYCFNTIFNVAVAWLPLERKLKSLQSKYRQKKFKYE